RAHSVLQGLRRTKSSHGLAHDSLLGHGFHGSDSRTRVETRSRQPCRLRRKRPNSRPAAAANTVSGDSCFKAVTIWSTASSLGCPLTAARASGAIPPL